MLPFKKPTLVTLRRQNSSQAWGFRLGGGAEVGQPFQIQKVTPHSLAYLGGLSEGDELVRIGNISLRGLTHDEVQQIILRCTHCVDLFILRADGQQIEPRIERSPDIINERSDVPYMVRPPHFQQISQESYKASSLQQQFQQTEIYQNNSQDVDLSSTKPTKMHLHSPTMVNHSMDDTKQDSNQSPRLFNKYFPQAESNEFKSIVDNQTNVNSNKEIELIRPNAISATQPDSSVPRKFDNRVFGINPRAASKSPIRIDHSVPITSPNEILISSNFSQQQTFKSQSNSLANKNLQYIENDSNNNPIKDDKKKIFGLTNHDVIKAIDPIGNHGVQPVNNEKKYFGINVRKRLNSISCDRDWKESLPMLNIPNTDQLLPSQTKLMQTYINQTPPTEKNLRFSLAGLQRRKIRPVWPPSAPKVNKGAYSEGRDSPNSRRYNWPPSRAQSVDRDFGYGERSESPTFHNSGRVRNSTKVWPPPSNATPAGRSGYIADENEDEHYAYNLSQNANSAQSLISSHVPTTYRPPPRTQYAHIINDF